MAGRHRTRRSSKWSRDFIGRFVVSLGIASIAVGNLSASLQAIPQHNSNNGTPTIRHSKTHRKNTNSQKPDISRGSFASPSSERPYTRIDHRNNNSIFKPHANHTILSVPPVESNGTLPPLRSLFDLLPQTKEEIEKSLRGCKYRRNSPSQIQDGLALLENLESGHPSISLSDLRQENCTLFCTRAAIRNIWETRRYHQIYAQSNKTEANRQDIIVASRFFSHIPKTGSTYGFRLLKKLIAQSPNYAMLRPEDRFQPCDGGLMLPRYYPNITIADESWIPSGDVDGRVCTLWMGEQRQIPASVFPFAVTPPASITWDHTYTMVRDPSQHVVSQYFHCKESTPHGSRASFMPETLAGWLEAWIKIIHGFNRTKTENANGTNLNDVGSHLGEDPIFRCYDPRNLQTSFTGFRYGELEVAGRENAKRDLKERFAVLGDTARATQSICLVAIHYTGWVPPRCECSNYTLPTNVISNRTANSITERFMDQHHGTMENISTSSPSETIRRSNGPTHSKHTGSATNHIELHSHGVQHHGSTYQISSHEQELIDQLTVWDRELYAIAMEILDEQIVEVEQSYGIKLCSGDLRDDITWFGRSKLRLDSNTVAESLRSWNISEFLALIGKSQSSS